MRIDRIGVIVYRVPFPLLDNPLHKAAIHCTVRNHMGSSNLLVLDTLLRVKNTTSRPAYIQMLKYVDDDDETNNDAVGMVPEIKAKHEARHEPVGEEIEIAPSSTFSIPLDQAHLECLAVRPSRAHHYSEVRYLSHLASAGRQCHVMCRKKQKVGADAAGREAVGRSQRLRRAVGRRPGELGRSDEEEEDEFVTKSVATPLHYLDAWHYVLSVERHGDAAKDPETEGSDDTQYTVVISPPIELENLLLAPMGFSLVSRASIEGGRGGGALPTHASSTTHDPVTHNKHGMVPRGRSLQFHQFESSTEIELTIHLSGFETKNFALIAPADLDGQRDTEETARQSSLHGITKLLAPNGSNSTKHAQLELREIGSKGLQAEEPSKGRLLVIDVEMVELENGSRKVHVYTKYWIINKSGLPLSYRMGPSLIEQPFIAHEELAGSVALTRATGSQRPEALKVKKRAGLKKGLDKPAGKCKAPAKAKLEASCSPAAPANTSKAAAGKAAVGKLMPAPNDVAALGASEEKEANKGCAAKAEKLLGVDQRAYDEVMTGEGQSIQMCSFPTYPVGRGALSIRVGGGKWSQNFSLWHTTTAISLHSTTRQSVVETIEEQRAPSVSAADISAACPMPSSGSTRSVTIDGRPSSGAAHCAADSPLPSPASPVVLPKAVAEVTRAEPRSAVTGTLEGALEPVPSMVPPAASDLPVPCTLYPAVSGLPVLSPPASPPELGAPPGRYPSLPQGLPPRSVLPRPSPHGTPSCPSPRLPQRPPHPELPPGSSPPHPSQRPSPSRPSPPPVPRSYLSPLPPNLSSTSPPPNRPLSPAASSSSTPSRQAESETEPGWLTDAYEQLMADADAPVSAGVGMALHNHAVTEVSDDGRLPPGSSGASPAMAEDAGVGVLPPHGGTPAAFSARRSAFRWLARRDVATYLYEGADEVDDMAAGSAATVFSASAPNASGHEDLATLHRQPDGAHRQPEGGSLRSRIVAAIKHWLGGRLRWMLVHAATTSAWQMDLARRAVARAAVKHWNWMSASAHSQVRASEALYNEQLRIARDWRGAQRMEVVVTTARMPREFYRTKLVNIMPRFVLTNETHMHLEISQQGVDTCFPLSSRSIDGESYPMIWHWPSASCPRRVLLRVLSRPVRQTETQLDEDGAGFYLPSLPFELATSSDLLDSFMVKTRPSPEGRLEGYEPLTLVVDRARVSGVTFIRFRLAAHHEMTFYVRNMTSRVISVGQRPSRLWPKNNLPPMDPVPPKALVPYAFDDPVGYEVIELYQGSPHPRSSWNQLAVTSRHVPPSPPTHGAGCGLALRHTPGVKSAPPATRILMGKHCELVARFG